MDYSVNKNKFKIGARITWFQYAFDGTIVNWGHGIIIKIAEHPGEKHPIVDVFRDNHGDVVQFSIADCEIEQDWIDA